VCAGYNLEVYRLAERGVPVDVMEVKDKVTHLSWEPSGNRFAVVSGEGARSTVGFYQVAERDKGIVPLFVWEGKETTVVHWSPRGEVAVLVSAGTGVLEFVDVDRKKVMATPEHVGSNGWAWDPSGRCFASWKTSRADSDAVRERVNNGYHLFTFQGTRLFDTMKPALTYFAWRPRVTESVRAGGGGGGGVGEAVQSI